MRKIRVAIATPSMIDQSRLASAFEGQSEFELVVQTHDLSSTYSRVEELMPDVVLVGAVFARADEYSCMLSLFKAVEAIPITITQGIEPVISEQKASDKPASIHSRLQANAIIDIIRTSISTKPAEPAIGRPSTIARVARHFSDQKIVLIGASTGGIDALTTLLGHFPKNCPPTAIVQHTGQNFRETLVRLLARRCEAEVVMAESGLKMKTGRICLAGGVDGHLQLGINGSLSCTISRGSATSGHMPSIDELFLSAVPFGARVMAVLLTGMGRDGATGLLSLRRAGAVTVGQDQATSVVYGMPRVAFEIGAVQRQLALDQIGPAILDWAATPRHSASIRRAAE
jgi:two-component system, chemotaxis family, protein-glutamate methylesterase/glutaminase